MQFQRTGFITGIVAAGLAAVLAASPVRADDPAPVELLIADEATDVEATDITVDDAVDIALPAVALDAEVDAEPLEVDAPAELPAVGEAEPIGLVRISDSSQPPAPAPAEQENHTAYAAPGCGAYSGDVVLSGDRLRDWWRLHKMHKQARHRARMIEEGHSPDCCCERCKSPVSDKMGRCADHLHRRYGYFCPSGGCGSGVQMFEHYGMVYPVNPGYFDARDGQLFSAQGYGVPMAVPLAPNVSHTYNYGWGIPSSRLTPISRPVHHPGYIGPR